MITYDYHTLVRRVTSVFNTLIIFLLQDPYNAAFFYIASGNGSTYFEIRDPASGQITLKRRLNTATSSAYEVSSSRH